MRCARPIRRRVRPAESRPRRSRLAEAAARRQQRARASAKASAQRRSRAHKLEALLLAVRHKIPLTVGPLADLS